MNNDRVKKCQAGIDCNNYYRCYDKKDNPTHECALDYCEIYVDDDLDEDVIIVRDSVVRNVVKQFVRDNGDFMADSGFEYDDDITMENVRRVMENMWYLKISGNKKFESFEQKSFELVLRLLDLFE